MTIILRNKQRFEEILVDYKPSDQALQLLDSVPMVVLCGFTGGGRSTIINELIKGGGFEYIASDTTRPMRKKDGQLVEEQGDPYWFISEEKMLKQLEQGEMIEAEIIHGQQVSGVNINTLRDASVHNKIAISDIEVAGVKTYRQYKPDGIYIFILIADFDEWMSRLRKRSDMSQVELARRLRSAKRELQVARNAEYFHLVINDSIDRAVEEVRSIAEQRGKNQTTNRSASDNELFDHLLAEIENYLSSTTNK